MVRSDIFSGMLRMRDVFACLALAVLMILAGGTASSNETVSAACEYDKNFFLSCQPVGNETVPVACEYDGKFKPKALKEFGNFLFKFNNTSKPDQAWVETCITGGVRAGLVAAKIARALYLVNPEFEFQLQAQDLQGLSASTRSEVRRLLLEADQSRSRIAKMLRVAWFADEISSKSWPAVERFFDRHSNSNALVHLWLTERFLGVLKTGKSPVPGMTLDDFRRKLFGQILNGVQQGVVVFYPLYLELSRSEGERKYLKPPIMTDEFIAQLNHYRCPVRDNCAGKKLLKSPVMDVYFGFASVALQSNGLPNWECREHTNNLEHLLCIQNRIYQKRQWCAEHFCVGKYCSRLEMYPLCKAGEKQLQLLAD